jgi:serine/threonine protein kinase
VEPELPLPAQFGRYVLKRRIGQGGMGDIYLASLPGGIAGVEKVCVIKKLRRLYTNDQEFVVRFLDEARLMVLLSHANIVPVFDAGQHEGDYYLAMEHVDGLNLRDLVAAAHNRRTVLPVAVTLHIAREILEGLSYAHRRSGADGQSLQLVHRDVSPQNVLCSLHGEVKLIDFGLATTRQKVMKTNPRVVLGKYAYMSPEQARGQPVDRRSDLFSVGLLLFEMLTGRKVFNGETVGALMEQIAEHRVMTPSKVVKGVDGELDAVVERALRKSAAERFQTAEEFRDALNRVMARLAPGLSPDALAAVVRETRAEDFSDEATLPVVSAGHGVKPMGTQLRSSVDTRDIVVPVSVRGQPTDRLERDGEDSGATEAEAVPGGGSSGTWILLAGVLVLLLGGGAAGLVLWRPWEMLGGAPVVTPVTPARDAAVLEGVGGAPDAAVPDGAGVDLAASASGEGVPSSSSADPAAGLAPGEGDASSSSSTVEPDRSGKKKTDPKKKGKEKRKTKSRKAPKKR